MNVHRFEENINGRDYLIEVSSVGADKWRAQIARLPGGSAALMPFYGKTPDEAAGQLSRWLDARARRQAALNRGLRVSRRSAPSRFASRRRGLCTVEAAPAVRLRYIDERVRQHLAAILSSPAPRSPRF